MADSALSSKKRPLDPFLLPPETRGRFRMLILAAVLVAWGLGGAVVGVPNVLRFRASPEHQRFLERITSAEDFDVEEVRTFSRTLQTSEEMQRLRRDLMQSLRRIAVSAFFVLALSVLAGCLYLAIPWIYRRRYAARRLTDAESPKVLAELRRHASRAGLDPMPEFCWKPGFLDGLAFGRRGKRVLTISGTPRCLERSWNDLHRAVALHELGHFVNRDVRTREIARVLWLALVALAVLAILLFLALRDVTFGALATFILKTVAVIGIAGALWSGLVRTREFYADWRVMAWGYGEALARRLTLAAPAVPRLFDALRLHPSNEERRRLLADPSPLFLVSRTLAFLTGTLLGLLSGNVATLALDSLVFLSYIGSGLVSATGSFFILVATALLVVLFVFGLLFALGYGVFGALGVQMLRSALAGLAEQSDADWGYLGLFLSSVTFVIGLEAGLLLTPLAVFGWGSAIVFWFVGVVFLIWIWLVQVRAMGRLVLGACSRGSTIRRLEVLLRCVAPLQLFALFLPAILGRLSIYAASDPSRLADLVGGVIPADVPMVLAAWCLVLLAVGLGLSALTNLAVLAAVVVWLFLRRPRCTACGHRADDWRFIGARCGQCGETLTSWLYLRQPPEGRVA